MNLKGKLYAESPVYRGNSRKTLFTRDGDGTHRLVSLAGEIEGTAQSLMDAFIGQSRNGKNIGLLNQLWQRLYGRQMPDRLISRVDCALQQASYPRDNFFDLRMGIRLDEDRWAAEANANYKLETLYRNSVFDFELTTNDSILQQHDNAAKLYYLLQELVEGRFWFGAGKSKGLGRFRLEMDLGNLTPTSSPEVSSSANHLRLTVAFDSTNPVLVGWNWGQVDPESPSFAAVEGRLLVEAMRNLPEPIRERLAISLGGPILSPDNWKSKFKDHFPRALAIWLQEQAEQEHIERWLLPSSELRKLGKGKYKLSKKLLEKLAPLADTPFSSYDAAETAISEAMAEKPNMIKRVLKLLVKEESQRPALNETVWAAIADLLAIDRGEKDEDAARIKQEVKSALDDEDALAIVLENACMPIFPQLYQQIDQHINLLQSDTWVDDELNYRQDHLQIKRMLLNGEIDEGQWQDRDHPPKGISAAAWREFLTAHRRVKLHHLLNTRNLKKSIVNDENMITFLRDYRNRTRQELSQPYNIDFRAGGKANREISRKYGKPYDTVFMRMLAWAPSAQEQGAWEIFIPGSTIKGAFKKRASQVLKTLLGETAKTASILDRLFGKQGQRGMVFFSDAYLRDPAAPEKAWCAMDGVKMDPKTGAPVESAKHDYLYAYGQQLRFQCQLDIQDLRQTDLEAFSVLLHLLEDFQRGDIPLGGEKSSGFGWVKAELKKLEWLTTDPEGIHQTLFPQATLTQQGIWQRLVLEDEAAVNALQTGKQALTAEKDVEQAPAPKAQAGFVSHRAFGGYCGMLFVSATVLTPLTIAESGEPSFTTSLQEGRVNGWDFFSMAPPDADHRETPKVYALPSKSLRGMLRHIYSIASDSRESSADISRLNPVDSLFGWVGRGQNQAIMGRVSITFGAFDNPTLGWFQIPYPYGDWHYANGAWQSENKGSVSRLLVSDTWRLFPHAPLAPCVKRLSAFEPDTFQANYCRAILPENRAEFTIRFWNLEQAELERLLWTVALEPDLAHKMGKHRYVGFGSLRLKILPQSYLIDWAARYAGKSEQEWQKPLDAENFKNTDVVAHYDSLRKALNADQL